MIVTKDWDYLELATLSHNDRVILLVTGNLKFNELEEFIGEHIERIVDFVLGANRVLILKK